MATAGDLVLALGGGTARAMSHVGVLLALEEAGLEPAGLAGTSFGAVVAALWALGTPVAQMRELLTAPTARQVWAQGMDPAPLRFSLIHGQRLEQWLDTTLYRGASFADLERPLAIATTSLATGELELVQEGSLARAVVASCSLPLLFAPVEIGGLWLVDGGFVEAVPFRAGLRLAPVRLLGVNTGIDTERAAMVAGIRGLRSRRWARAVSDWGISRSLDSGGGRVLRGLSWAARSYGRPQPVPSGGGLLRVNPAIAWWDFHRTTAAVESGLLTTRLALEGGLLDRLSPVDTTSQEASVEDGRGAVAAERPERAEPLVDRAAEAGAQPD